MKIEIYGTSWCTYCKSATALCESKSIGYEYIDIDDTKNMRALEERLGFKVKSVPQIFKDDVLIHGGFNGLKQELSKIK